MYGRMGIRESNSLSISVFFFPVKLFAAQKCSTSECVRVKLDFRRY